MPRLMSRIPGAALLSPVGVTMKSRIPVSVLQFLHVSNSSLTLGTMVVIHFIRNMTLSNWNTRQPKILLYSGTLEGQYDSTNLMDVLWMFGEQA